jgi:hypothetical protein
MSDPELRLVSRDAGETADGAPAGDVVNVLPADKVTPDAPRFDAQMASQHSVLPGLGFK